MSKRNPAADSASLPASGYRRDLRWWKFTDPNDAAASLIAYARSIEDASSTKARDTLHRRHARMYGNAEILGVRPWDYNVMAATEQRLQLNVVASCIDTAVAKLGTNRPAPQFLTNGADWETRRKADKLNKFGKGMLHQVKAYAAGTMAMRDACIFGTAFLKVYEDADGKCLGADRVLPWNILVEDADGFGGKPRTLTQRMFIDRAVAKEMWPDAADAIDRNSDPRRGATTDAGQPGDQVVVYESWHLASGPKASDGRHIIAVDGACLLDEPWKRDHFPFAVLRWEEPIAGYWGRGIAEKLTGIQYEINLLLQRIQNMMRMLGVTKVIVEQQSGVPKAHINNEVGTIYHVAAGSRPPTVVAPQSVHPEYFQQLDRLYQRAFQEIGISELAAQSRKPSGLDSKVALREFNDIESERFQDKGRAFEQFYMDIVALGIETARTMKGFSVDVPDRDAKVTIDWADVSLERDAYILQCWPVSILPQTPSGRLQTVQDMMESGMLAPDRARELLNAPDLEEEDDTALAPIRALRQRIAAMLENGDYQAPEPFDNLEMIVSRTQAVYLMERERGCPENRLQLLRRYIEEAANLLKQSQPAPAAPAMPGPPMGAPPMPGAPGPVPAPMPVPVAA